MLWHSLAESLVEASRLPAVLSNVGKNVFRRLLRTAFESARCCTLQDLLVSGVVTGLTDARPPDCSEKQMLQMQFYKKSWGEQVFLGALQLLGLLASHSASWKAADGLLFDPSCTLDVPLKWKIPYPCFKGDHAVLWVTLISRWFCSLRTLTACW